MSSTRFFKPYRYLRYPVFTVPEGLSIAHELFACFPKVSPALLKRAKDNLQQVATAAQTALIERSHQTHLISAEDSTVLDVEMHRAWTTMLLRMDATTMLPHDKYPVAARAEELVKRLFYSDGPECFQDTYAAQLSVMRRMLQRIKEDQLEKELDEICSPPFLGWIREVLPRYQKIVHALQNREEQLVNLLVHRNALSRAMITYATAMCLTVIEEEDDTIQRCYDALAPLEDISSVTARNDLTATDAPAYPATRTADEAPLPA